jgi:hypothetical protein
MAWFSKKKLPFLFLAVYTALSVLGVFSFAAADGLRLVYVGPENPVLGNVYAAQDNFFIQCTAEEPIVISKPGAAQCNPVRAGFQRTVFLPGFSGAGNASSVSSLAVNARTPYTNAKNNILLKLRI